MSASTFNPGASGCPAAGGCTHRRAVEARQGMLKSVSQNLIHVVSQQSLNRETQLFRNRDDDS